MAVASMTGFARGTGQDGPLTWVWEAKSVNGRGLDTRCRLPPGMDSLDAVLRKAAAKRFKRGNISVSLHLDRSAAQQRVRINREALDQLTALVGEIKGADGPPPDIERLLTVRGVVELTDEEDTADARERRQTMMATTLEETLDGLAAARREEGGRIATVLAGQLDEIAALVETAADSAALRPETLRARIEEQIAEVLSATPPLPEERIAQEMALLLVKGDVREEVDRLRAHIASARDLIGGGGVVGRRLDFLCQEFNREANTLCSKASDLDLTRTGLELKTVIDQFREQVQNIE